MKGMLKKFLAVPLALLLWTALPAYAGQTSVAVSGVESFQQTTGNFVVRQVPSNGAGFMIELRHISSPLMGYDVSYEYHRADQLYEGGCAIAPCTPTTQQVNSNVHGLSANWVVSVPIYLAATSFRAFALAGGGFQKFEPTSSQSGGTQSQTEATFDYGAGFDWNLLYHLGLRFQYRGDLYNAPRLSTSLPSSGQTTHDAQMLIGAFFRF